MPRILITGGNGRLGTELRALLPDMIAPSSRELDVTDPVQVRRILQAERPDLVVHAAAYTNVGKAEQERERCWSVNVGGTRNMADGVNEIDAKLIHISTDYVFSGETGNYCEDDMPGPVVNYYSLTKLVAEEAARRSKNCLILRTSFRPREFQYQSAFSDLYTGQDYVDIIAPMILSAVVHAQEIPYDVLNVVTERKSVFELARRRSPSVREGRRSEAGVILPSDVSLNRDRWIRMDETWN